MENWEPKEGEILLTTKHDAIRADRDVVFFLYEELKRVAELKYPPELGRSREIMKSLQRKFGGAAADMWVIMTQSQLCERNFLIYYGWDVLGRYRELKEQEAKDGPQQNAPSWWTYGT